MRSISGEILFAGVPDLEIDPVVLAMDPDMIAERVIALTMQEGAEGSFLHGQFDILVQSR
ncbi:MAG: hypothetical protein AAF639_16680 [Chloroflexota bacterium]